MKIIMEKRLIVWVLIYAMCPYFSLPVNQYRGSKSLQNADCQAIRSNLGPVINLPTRSINSAFEKRHAESLNELQGMIVKAADLPELVELIFSAQVKEVVERKWVKLAQAAAKKITEFSQGDIVQEVFAQSVMREVFIIATKPKEIQRHIEEGSPRLRKRKSCLPKSGHLFMLLIVTQPHLGTLLPPLEGFMIW
jgi:hypothetical protein